VPQGVADALDSNPLLQQTQCKRMPQDMRSARRQVQTAVFEPMHHHLADRGWLKGATRGHRPQKQLTMRAGWASFAQVADEHLSGFIRQRQLESLAGFGLFDTQRAFAPVDVVKRQPDQLSTAQPIGGGQIQQRKVTLSDWFGSVDGSEEREHLRPRQSTRQLLTAVHSWPVDLEMEGSG
jgi:hypothetical protein